MSSGLAAIFLAVLAGAAFGALHLLLLRIGARALAGPRPGRTFVALALLRALLLVGALVSLAVLGGGAEEFVGALMGFVAARLAALRMVREQTGKAE